MKTIIAYVILLVVIFGISFLIDLCRSTDNTDKSKFTRSGLSLYTDYGTGLQYIKGGFFGNMMPRLDKHGRHMFIEVKAK